LGTTKIHHPPPKRKRTWAPCACYFTSLVGNFDFIKIFGINNKYNFKSSTKPKNIFNLCQNGKGITVYICLFQKEPFDWPNTNIFGTWSTPPNIEA
jgi:hypothetical protein